MVAHVQFSVLHGCSGGDHAIGSVLKEAGVTVTIGLLQFTTTSAHRFRPTAPVSAPSPPAGLYHPAAFLQCTLTRTNGTGGGESIGANHKIVHTNADAGGAGSETDFQILEKTTGDWDIYVAGAVRYTHTPTQGVAYHIEMICGLASAAATGYSWANGASVVAVVIIDGVVVYNAVVTAATGGSPLFNNGAAPTEVLTFGESAGIGGTAVFRVDSISMGFTDLWRPIGQVAVFEWALSLGVTPPTGYDQAFKSTGTDAAALIDERPPNGSGVIDSDYYDIVEGGSQVKQVSALADTLLSAGDVLYAVRHLQWSRSYVGTKVFSFLMILHDGTNVAGLSDVLATSPSNYIEEVLRSPGTNAVIHHTAPDARPWWEKANGYLDGMFIGNDVDPASAADSGGKVSTIIAESAVILSGNDVKPLRAKAAARIMRPALRARAVPVNRTFRRPTLAVAVTTPPRSFGYIS